MLNFEIENWYLQKRENVRAFMFNLAKYLNKNITFKI